VQHSPRREVPFIGYSCAMRTQLLLIVVIATGLFACGKKDRTADSPLAQAAKACLHHDSEVSCPRPILTVDNLAASTRYYRDKLGFKLDWDYGEPPDFASVSRGDGVLFMCQGCQGHPGAWTMLFTRDVDKLHDELRKRGATIKMAPTDMPWGLREMQVSDPDGNVLRFGSAIRD
jgi:catechol 2,3-dioxygenase-like lactoylglutathione lyase family enzyme